jgi:outer membrane protein TolC
MAQLNALRDKPGDTPLEVAPPPRYPQVDPDARALRQGAVSMRPEIDEADAQIQSSQALIGLSKKESVPDLTVGLTYSFVGDRGDPAGRLAPPPDNGKNVLGITAGINLPIWRGKISAAVAEARLHSRAAEEARRSLITQIDQALDDLVQRIPLAWARVRLFEDQLSLQAEESLRSAEAGYAAGTLQALDLLDAERVLLDVKIATARAHADYAIALAQLEGTVGFPLPMQTMNQEP